MTEESGCEERREGRVEEGREGRGTWKRVKSGGGMGGGGEGANE